MGKVWMIASGKGGTGKTTLTASVAVAMAKCANKVCVVDASVGLKGIDLLLGMENRVVFDAFDVMEDTCTLEAALVSHEAYPNLCLLSTSQTENAQALKARQFEHIIKKLKKRFDAVLIDCPPGADGLILDIAQSADACVLTVTPDDAALRTAEKLSAMLFEHCRMEMNLAVNGVNEKLIHDGMMMEPGILAATLDAPLIGELPVSDGVYRALLQHKTPLETGEKPYAAAVVQLAARMQGEDVPCRTYRVRRKKWFQHAEG